VQVFRNRTIQLTEIQIRIRVAVVVDVVVLSNTAEVDAGRVCDDCQNDEDLYLDFGLEFIQ